MSNQRRLELDKKATLQSLRNLNYISGLRATYLLENKIFIAYGIDQKKSYM